MENNSKYLSLDKTGKTKSKQSPLLQNEAITLDVYKHSVVLNRRSCVANVCATFAETWFTG